MKRKLTVLIASLGLVAGLSGCTNEELARAAIERYFHQKNVPKAMSVVECESGYDPNAVSPDNQNHGLFQINNVHREWVEEELGYDWSERYDRNVNTHIARKLWDESRWGPWSCA